MFIPAHADKEVYISLAHIRKVSRSANGQHFIAEQDDGKLYKVYEYVWQETVRGFNRQAWPAAPNTYIVGTGLDNKVWKIAVVGWAQSDGFTLEPITVDGHDYSQNVWYALQPDGRVEASDGAFWPSLEAWQEAVGDAPA